MVNRQSFFDTPIGTLTLIASDDGVSRVLFDGQTPGQVGLADDLPVIDNDPVLLVAEAQIHEYFAGDRKDFDLPLDLHGTEFQVEAWRSLASVPYGETTSYGEQAERIGRPGAFRAVGAANGKNPVPIILPCHRIVGANGSLTGFAGGLELKQWLLSMEQTQQSFPGV